MTHVIKPGTTPSGDQQAPGMSTITRTTCRLCGSKELQDVFTLGNQYINDFVPAERIGKGLTAPLELVICRGCSLLQLRHTAPQELLYARHYWYRSGVTDTMRRALSPARLHIVNLVAQDTFER